MKKSVLILLIVIASIAKQAQAQIITTFAGNGTQGYIEGCPATAAELYQPFGVTPDAAGNLYIADTYNSRIRKVNTAGIILNFAGNGTYAYSGDGGAATTAEMNAPRGVAFDGAGNMYIADQYDHRIRKVNTLGIISTYAGNGTPGYSGDGASATAAKLYSPFGVTLDAAGNMYIADNNNHRIRKVNTAGIISTIAGGGSNYPGDGGPATAASLGFPYAIAFDAVGNLYFSDGPICIRKVTTAGIISTIAGGTQGYSGDGGPATAAQLNAPTGIAFDATGNLYISDAGNNVIRKVNTLGIISTIAGNGTAAYAGDGGNATAAELNQPAGIAFDASGNLYIADFGNSRIRKVTMCYTPTVSYTLTNTVPHYWTAYPTYTAYTDSVRWYWGDGTDTLALYPSHTYSVAGRYNICVTAYSSCGDSAQYCQNDTVYRLGNNSAYSTMVYINIDSSSSHTTGITPLSFGEGQGVRLYPNPNNGSFVIEPIPSLTLPQGKGILMQVYDVNGKLVLSQTINPETSSGQAGKTTIDASSLNEGVYNISLLSNEGVINKRLVIVR